MCSTRLGISDKFLGKVAGALGAVSPDREILWWSTDYHLDWLSAVLHIFQTGQDELEPIENRANWLTHDNDDIDLIIADNANIILIEVKACGGWKGFQLKEKGGRLRALNAAPKGVIFRSDSPTSKVKLWFALLSRSNLQKKSVSADWRNWMLNDSTSPTHINLGTGHKSNPSRPARWNG